MKTFDFVLKGISPLLINGYSPDFGQDPKVVKKKKNEDFPTPRESMERKIYTDKKGIVWVPSSWISGTIASVASEYKLPGSRKSLKSVIGGAVIPIDEKMYFIHKKQLKKKDIEVDSRPVAIQRSSSKVMCHRGRLEPGWKLKGTLQIDSSIVPEKTVLELLNDAGRRAGIGDFRPNRGGPFGRFQVSLWKEQK